MANQNKLILTLMSFLLLSCFEDKRVDYQVSYKCIVKDNPNFSSYQYFIGLNSYDMIDSANKFNIGDDVRMYSKPMANQNKLYFVIELTANPLGGLSEGRTD